MNNDTIPHLRLELIKWLLNLDDARVRELHQQYLLPEEEQVALYQEQAAYEETQPYEEENWEGLGKVGLEEAEKSVSDEKG